jgi:hypothetical protein
MSGKKRNWNAPSATPWDGIVASDSNPAELLVKAYHRDKFFQLSEIQVLTLG